MGTAGDQMLKDLVKAIGIGAICSLVVFGLTRLLLSEALHFVTAVLPSQEAHGDQTSGATFWPDKLSALMTTLIGSFFGAYFAFLLQRRRTELERDEDRVGAANRALYNLYRMWNVLSQYQREHLEPVRNAPDRWLNLTASPLAPSSTTKFELGELSFLLQTKEASVFADVMLEEERFGLALGLIDRRSALVLEEVFPRMARAQIAVGDQRPIDEIQRTLGIDIVHQLQQPTDHIFTFVDDDITSLRAAHAQLRAAVKRLYPDQKFIEVDWQRRPAA